MSKPFDFLKTIQSYIAANRLCSGSDRLLLAVSGGVDSVVMAYVMRALGYDIGLCHINFNLRGSESDHDALFIKKLSEQFEVPVYIHSADALQYSEAHKLSIQEAARAIRYDFFQKIAGDYSYDKICTAHHIEDQMETILYRLFKGAGLKGLLGIPVQNQSIIRPLLGVTKTQIADYADQNKIPYREDSSNATLKYQRNLIRHKIMPHISSVNASWPQTLQQQLSIWQSTYDFYTHSAGQYWSSRYHQKFNILDYYSVEDLKDTPGHLSLLYTLLSKYEFNTMQTTSILSDILDSKSGTIYLSTAYELLLYRNQLIFRPKNNPTKLQPMKWSIHDNESIVNDPYFQLKIKDKPSKKYYSLPVWPKIDTYILRSWQEGDTFHPDGMKGQKKKLSDFFTDIHIDRFARDLTVLVCDQNNKVIWIPGCRYDEKYLNEVKTRGHDKYLVFYNNLTRQ